MKKLILILMLGNAFAVTTDDIYDNSYALVIGIDKYENVDKLNYAVQDAEAIKNLLVSSFNFPEKQIIMLTDKEATLDNIRTKLFEVATSVNESDRLLVYFAGHGETYNLKSGGERGYLIPVDGDLDNIFATCLPMSDIKEVASVTVAKHVLFLMDACYGGLLAVDARSISKTTSGYIDKITRDNARQIITAGGKGEQVIEKSEWGHSAFAKNLLHGLKTGIADEDSDGYITADELGSFLKKRVTIDSDNNQTPVTRRFGSDEGEFVFINTEYKQSSISTTINKNQQAEYESLKKDFQKLKNETKIFLNQNKNRVSDDFNNDLIITEDYLNYKNIHPFWAWTQINFNYKGKKYSPTIYFPTDYNRVDGFVMGYGKRWATIKPTAMSLDAALLWATASKEWRYEVQLERFFWRSKKISANIEIWKDSFSIDHWLLWPAENSISALLFNRDYADYYGSEGHLIGTTIYTASNIVLYPHLDFMKDSRIKKNTDFSIFYPEKEFRNNYSNNPEIINEGNINQFHMHIFPKKIRHQYVKHEFKLELPDTLDGELVYLLAESPNWPERMFEMGNINNNYTTTILLPHGRYLYRFLIDDKIILDPQNQKTIQKENGDNVSSIEIGRTMTYDGEITLSDKSLGSDFQFQRYTASLILDLPLSYRELMSIRIVGGTANGDVPGQQLFHLGGFTTLRGYDYREFFGSQLLLVNLDYKILINYFDPLKYIQTSRINNLKKGYGYSGIPAYLRFYIDAGVIGNENQNHSIKLNYGIGIELFSQISVVWKINEPFNKWGIVFNFHDIYRQTEAP